MRDRDGHPVGQFNDRASQRIDFQRSARQKVLEHRRSVAADARGTPQPAIDGYRDIDADPARDLDNLFHCRANHRRSDSRFSNILQACAGQRTHRVENSVAEELDPEVLSNIALHRRLEAGRHQCLSERLDPWRGDAIEFAEREPVALDVPLDGGIDLDLGPGRARSRPP